MSYTAGSMRPASKPSRRTLSVPAACAALAAAGLLYAVTSLASTAVEPAGSGTAAPAASSAPTTAAPPAVATPVSTAPSRPVSVQLIDTDHPLAGRIWSVHERRFVEEAAVAAALRDARFVLLGERHGNPEHHRLQGRLIREVGNRGGRLAIVAEQLDFPQQPAVDACAADCADFGADLGARVDWARSGWPEYALYAPVFEAAAASRAGVYAGNPGAKRVRALSRGDAPAADEAAWVARAREPLQPESRERLLEHLSAGHCGHLPREHAEPLVYAQRLRDAALAATLVRTTDASAGAGATGVLIAGAGHARRDYGVPTLLDPDARSVVVAFLEVAPDVKQPERYAPADAYDFLWFTARVDEPDPCEQFREQLRKMKPAAAPR